MGNVITHTSGDRLAPTFGSVIVFGGRGLLGKALVDAITSAGGTAVVGDLPEVDIVARGVVERMMEVVRPQLVVNCAAVTDVDACERHPAIAFSVNAVGAENVARCAELLGLPMVHVSTDFVFDGAAGRRYRESDIPRPQSVYGRSKLEGEERVLQVCSQSFVVRSGYLYGRGGRNFGSTLVWRLRRGEVIRADRSRRVAPTWVRPLAATILRIVETGMYGIWHAGCEGETTWFDFAKTVAWRVGIDGAIEGVETESLPLLAPRPLCSLLENCRLCEAGLPAMPRWDEALDGFLAEEL